MPIGKRVAEGFLSMLCLGMLLGALSFPLQAGDRAAQLINEEIVLAGGVQRGVPQGGRPLYSPPVFMERGTPVSERPFANPFIDRGSPMSERPLAPIGGGAQVAPGSVPHIWCQGQWVSAASPGHGCSSR